MKKVYIKPETLAFQTEVESMICQSPLTYEGTPVVTPNDPVLSKERGFEAEDFDFDFIK